MQKKQKHSKKKTISLRGYLPSIIAEYTRSKTILDNQKRLLIFGLRIVFVHRVYISIVYYLMSLCKRINTTSSPCRE